MKNKVTRKYINMIFDDIFSVGYCGCQFLLWDISPFAYNSGVYGWNCDYYNIGGVIICTGYRPHGRSTTGKTAEYEKMAYDIYHNYELSYDERIEKIRGIRNEWISKLLEE